MQQQPQKCVAILKRLVTLAPQLPGGQSTILTPLSIQLASYQLALRQLPDAEATLQGALAHQEALTGKMDPSLLPLLSALADCDMFQRKIPDAAAAVQRMVTLGQQAYGMTDARLLPLMSKQVQLAQMAQDTARATATLKSMVVLAAHNPDVPVSQTQQFGLQLADAYRAAGDHDLAQTTYVQLLGFLEGRAGHDDVVLLPVLYAQSAECIAQAPGKAAQDAYLRAITIGDNAHQPTEVRLATLQRVAELAVRNTDLGSARACEAHITALAAVPTAPTVLTALLTLATTYQTQQHPVEAEATLQHALALGTGLLGEKDAHLVPLLQEGVRLAVAQNKPEQAEALSQRLLAVTAAGAGANPATMIEALEARADVLLAAQQPDKAEAALLQARALATGKPGSESMVLQRLGTFYTNQKAPDKAIAVYRQLVTLQETTQGKTGPALCFPLIQLAMSLAAGNQAPEAETVLARVTALIDGIPDVIGAAMFRGQAAEGYSALHEYAKAAALVQASLTALEHANGPAATMMIPFLYRAASYAQAQGMMDEAAKFQQRAQALQGAPPPAR